MSNSLFNFWVQSLLVQPGNPYESALTGIVPVTRTQSATLNLNYARQNEFGWDGGGDQVMVERPTVALDFSYFPTNGINERNLGFKTDGMRSALISLDREQNYYVIANLDGQDMLGYSGLNTRVLALGNGVITNYAVNLAVGQVPTANVTVEGLNLLIQTGRYTEALPSVDKQTANPATGLYSIAPFFNNPNYADPNPANNITATRPGDLVLQFDTGSSLGITMSGANACALQSCSFTVALPRDNVKEIGAAYPSFRPIQWPINVNVQAQGVVTDYQLAALNQFYCPDSGFGINLLFRQPCSNQFAMAYAFRNVKLETQSFQSQIGQSNRVTFNWSTRIYDLTQTGANSANFYMQAFGGTYGYVLSSTSMLSGTDTNGDFSFNEESLYTQVILENLA